MLKHINHLRTMYVFKGAYKGSWGHPPLRTLLASLKLRNDSWRNHRQQLLCQLPFSIHGDDIGICHDIGYMYDGGARSC